MTVSLKLLFVVIAIVAIFMAIPAYFVFIDLFVNLLVAVSAVIALLTLPIRFKISQKFYSFFTIVCRNGAKIALSMNLVIACSIAFSWFQFLGYYDQHSRFLVCYDGIMSKFQTRPDPDIGTGWGLKINANGRPPASNFGFSFSWFDELDDETGWYKTSDWQVNIAVPTVDLLGSSFFAIICLFDFGSIGRSIKFKWHPMQKLPKNDVEINRVRHKNQ